jgi:chromosome segregation ATPase
MSGLLPSEDDDGSAAEIARLRAEASTLRMHLEGEKVAAQGAGSANLEAMLMLKEYGSYPEGLRERVERVLAEVARLRTALATAERERDEARDKLGAVLVERDDARMDAMVERSAARTSRNSYVAVCDSIAAETSGVADAVAKIKAIRRDRDTALASLASTSAELEAAMGVIGLAGMWADSVRDYISSDDGFTVTGADSALLVAVDAFRSRTKEKQP